MTPALATAILIALACLLAIARLLWRVPPTRRRRHVVLAALQIPLALALWWVLYPPARMQAADTLVVLTPGAPSRVPAGSAIALPGVDAPDGVVQVPDLATALRQQPGVARLQIVGDGLPARDRDAVGDLPLSFTPPAQNPPTLLYLTPPADVAPGALFTVHARVQRLVGGRAELLDPAGRRVDRITVGKDGALQVQGITRDAGQVEFRLRLYAADGGLASDVPVPLQVITPTPLSVRLLSAAANPETKYLRRWLEDSGNTVIASIDAGAGLRLGDAPAALDAQQLAQTDLLILDARSLQAMSASTRQRLRDAIRGGLGVLLRMEGGVDAGVRRAAREIGLSLQGDGKPIELAPEATQDDAMRLARRGLQQHAGLEFTTAAKDADVRSRAANAPALAGLQLQLDNGDAQSFPSVEGIVAGQWRALGQGRIGALLTGDSYQWSLAGRDDLHAQLWAQLATTLARSDMTRVPSIQRPAQAWAGERSQVCGLVDDAAQLQAVAPGGAVSLLAVDPATAEAHCAAWWPSVPGWHVIHAGAEQRAVYVFDPEAMGGLHRAQMMQQTLRLVGGNKDAGAATLSVPGLRWPWLLLFVLLATVAWLLERRWVRDGGVSSR